MKMDVHWVDIKVTNGIVYPKMVVRGGRFITGFTTDVNEESNIPFNSRDISNIRRQSLFYWWPFWS